jgi:DNA-binding transcriptional LysR family regulator
MAIVLDPASVRLFVLAARFGNLTRAAEAAGTVQPVVSQRLRQLEERLGRRLLERSPRHVRLTAEGAAFLPRAEALLAAHEDALRPAPGARFRFAVGFSDHATGLGLEAVLRRVRSALPPEAVLEVRVGLSHAMRAAWEAGECDACILRREAGGQDGEVLGTDPLGWRAAPGPLLDDAGPVPLAVLEAPCGVRAAALRVLDAARRPWREAFSAGSCAALLAGVRAGCGIAPMGRLAAGDMPDRGPELRLPPLPASEIVLHGRAGTPVLAAALRALASGMRASLG